MEKRDGKHFVLIHGACHGAWCWYKVATLLKSDGHKVTALDLGASGIHPKQVHELRSISDYYEPLMLFMDSLPPEDTVILVGHSLGGVAISVAMERFPHKVSLAVFVTALMPSEDLTYPALHHQDLTLALSLVRPLRIYNDLKLLQKETAVTKQSYGTVTKVYIVCDRDNSLKEDFQRWMIEKNPPLEVKVIADSDHMPMFSKPIELSSCLLEFAGRY